MIYAVTVTTRGYINRFSCKRYLLYTIKYFSIMNMCIYTCLQHWIFCLLFISLPQFGTDVNLLYSNIPRGYKNVARSQSRDFAR